VIALGQAHEGLIIAKLRADDVQLLAYLLKTRHLSPPIVYVTAEHSRVQQAGARSRAGGGAVAFAATVRYNAPGMVEAATRRWSVRALAVAAVALACVPVAMAGVETDVEEGIGRFLAEAFIAQRGRLSQPPIDGWITGMGAELVACCPRRDLDYHFIVLDSPEANGFALPGGWVFVTAGLLETVRSDDEVAAVMAHELGHLVDRDFQRIIARTLLWLGVAELVRDSGRDDLVPLVQGVQLVNTLRHSRRREAQADDVGCGIAWDAGYDPTALVEFLGSAPAWSYLETVFATHPHPDRRGGWIRERIATLRADDPAGALALARSLVRRGRCGAARRLLDETLPGDDAGRRALLERIAHLTATAPTDAADRLGLPDDALADLTSARSCLDGAASGGEATRAEAWRRLRRMWEDAEIERALVVAQAYDPELTDVGYLGLLAQTVDLMHRAVRGGNLVARTLSMRSSTANGLRTLAGDLSTAGTAPDGLPVLELTAQRAAALAAEVAESADQDIAGLARLAGDYCEAARLVAPLLLQLASAGEGDPMGRLVFSRFMIIQAQVTGLSSRIARLDADAEPLAACAWRAAIDLHVLRLNLTGAAARSHVRPALVRVIARRLRTSPGRLKAEWRARGGLGDAALVRLEESLEADGREFGSRLRAAQIIIRLSFCDAQEQVAVGPKENSTREGEDTVALRGTVGHPQ